MIIKILTGGRAVANILPITLKTMYYGQTDSQWLLIIKILTGGRAVANILPITLKTMYYGQTDSHYW